LRREACLRLDPTFAPCRLRHHDRGREKIQRRRRPAPSSSAASKRRATAAGYVLLFQWFLSSERREATEECAWAMPIMHGMGGYWAAPTVWLAMRVNDVHYAVEWGIQTR
jgi:hypothetical protein